MKMPSGRLFIVFITLIFIELTKWRRLSTLDMKIIFTAEIYVL
mgnify:CR=1 FL=1